MASLVLSRCAAAVSRCTDATLSCSAAFSTLSRATSLTASSPLLQPSLLTGRLPPPSGFAIQPLYQFGRFREASVLLSVPVPEGRRLVGAEAGFERAENQPALGGVSFSCQKKRGRSRL